MHNTDQLELGFDGRPQRKPSPQQQTQHNKRAHWWFSQMRRVVDMAIAWQPTPPGRPEQVYFALTPKRS